jgi:GH35 family endo-1,4-beta-xylanase
MMEVTAAKVSVWDAVNESISGRDNDGDGFYDLESAAWGSSNNFYWQDYLGSEDYVRIVIAAARKYYAEYGGTKPLKLFINDYNLESDWDANKKLKSLIHWIGKWESDGVTKIDGIGTQMHISYYENAGTQASKEQHIVKMLQLMANTGKLVKISELDMGYVDKNGNTLHASQLTDQQHRVMADYYRFIVRKYFEIVPPAQQYGITHWCITDPESGWRALEPVGLWDASYNRKYAYAGFADGLRGK